MISLTNRCQSKCKYCNIPLRKQKELSTKEILSLLDQLKKLGTQRIAFWGGEPLVRKDIGKLIDYAKNLGFYVTLDTNGYLVPQKLNQIKNLDLLLVSFDGNEKTHDRNREKGSHKKALEAINSCKNKIPVWTITVLTKNNLDQIDYIMDLAKKMNFKTTFQILHHSKALSKNDQTMLPASEDYKQVIKQLLQKKKNKFPIVSSIKYLKKLLEWQDYSFSHRVKKKKGDIPCWAGNLFCNVDTDGKVYPCVVLIEKTKALNFLDVGFKKAFDNLSNTKCSACTASCLIEFNMMFSLYPSVIYNWIKYTK
jgi:MoaA/NifB/PqqE/SkfB family radical SAM enzyme